MQLTPQRRSKYGPEAIQRLADLYVHGLSLAACALQTGIPRDTVRYLLLREGVALRDRGRHYNRTDPANKVCARCHQLKPVGQFYVTGRTIHGRATYGYCKPCHKEARNASTARLLEENPDRRRDFRLKSLYKLSLQQYEAMVSSQNGRCYVCMAQPAERLLVDHDHSTGRVRKLLCRSCNLALGYVRDNPQTLRRLIAYLGEHK